MPIGDDMEVKEMFNYQRNKLFAKCNFMSVAKYNQQYVEELKDQL